MLAKDIVHLAYEITNILIFHHTIIILSYLLLYSIFCYLGQLYFVFRSISMTSLLRINVLLI